jgi:hypothetical protein
LPPAARPRIRSPGNAEQATLPRAVGLRDNGFMGRTLAALLSATAAGFFFWSCAQGVSDTDEGSGRSNGGEGGAGGGSGGIMATGGHDGGDGTTSSSSTSASSSSSTSASSSSSSSSSVSSSSTGMNCMVPPGPCDDLVCSVACFGCLMVGCCVNNQCMCQMTPC